MSEFINFFFREDLLPEGSEQKTLRLDKLLLLFLEEQADMGGFSRSQLQKWIKDGAVLIDRKVEKRPGAPVKVGASLTLLAREEAERDFLEPYDFELDVVFEDEDLAVVNKPAGLTVHPGAGNPNKTLLNALLHRYSGYEKGFEGSAEGRLGIVHRLDKDTSGLLVVARNSQALRGLAEQFAARTAQRHYLALLESTPRRQGEFEQESSGVIDAPIARDPGNKLRMAIVEGGKHARSNWTVKERLGNGLLVDFKLDTGRTHQIRVHAAHAGAPLLGDPLYRREKHLPDAVEKAVLKLSRQALHAYSLAFKHPSSGEQLKFEVGLPEDIEELLKELRSLMR